MSRRQLHTTTNPWRMEKNKICANLTHEEVENKNLIRTVRDIFNKVTPTNKELMRHRLYALNIYESPVLDEILSMIFEKAVLEPIFCPLYVTMCNSMVRNEMIVKGVSKIRNSLLVRAQEMFTAKNFDECEREKCRRNRCRAEIDAETNLRVKRVMEIALQEEQSKFRRRKLGQIRWLGQLYLHNLISIRIITFCVVDLLKSVTTRSLLDGFHPDNEAVECAVRLLEVIGKRLDEEAAAAAAAHRPPCQPLFPLELTFQTLNGAMPLVISRIRFLIMDLLELRERGWVPRRTEERPKTLDEIKEDIKKEKMEDKKANKSWLLGCLGASTKKSSLPSANATVGGETSKSSIELAREHSEKEARSVLQMNSRFLADWMSPSSASLIEKKVSVRGAVTPPSSSKSDDIPTSTTQKEKKTKITKPVDTSISTDSFDELTDECCCTICHEFFDSDKFIPRSLDCGHEFCEVCIYNDKMRMNNCVKCPLCKKTTNVPVGRVLPVVYKLISISEKLMKTKVDPKISCKACKINFSPSSLCMCNKQDCDMFGQLLCLNCALDGDHIAHVVKYDVKIEKESNVTFHNQNHTAALN